MSTLSKERLHKLWDALLALHYELVRDAAGDPLEEKIECLYWKVSEMLNEVDERLGGE